MALITATVAVKAGISTSGLLRSAGSITVASEIIPRISVLTEAEVLSTPTFGISLDRGAVSNPQVLITTSLGAVGLGFTAGDEVLEVLVEIGGTIDHRIGFSDTESYVPVAATMGSAGIFVNATAAAEPGVLPLLTFVDPAPFGGDLFTFTFHVTYAATHVLVDTQGSIEKLRLPPLSDLYPSEGIPVLPWSVSGPEILTLSQLQGPQRAMQVLPTPELDVWDSGVPRGMVVIASNPVSAVTQIGDAAQLQTLDSVAEISGLSRANTTERDKSYWLDYEVIANASNSIGNNLEVTATSVVVPSEVVLATGASIDVVAGVTVKLDTLGIGPADHAIIAVNKYGDVVQVNQTIETGSQSGVEYAVMTHRGNRDYTAHGCMVAGAGTANILGLDSCEKPDCAALADGSFQITWSRHDLNLIEDSVLEVALVRTRDSDGYPLTVPTLDKLSIGVGYALDTAVVSGDGEVTPDSFSFGNAYPVMGGIVYISQTAKVVSAPNTFRTYEMRLRRIDWSISPPTVTGGILQSDIPVDENFGSPATGGLVFPDVVLDNFGHLIVAYEEYILALNPNYVLPDTGHIVVNRYSGIDSTPQWALLDTEYLSGGVVADRQRKPNVAATQTDTVNRVSVIWTDLSTALAYTPALHREVTFASAETGSSVAVSHWNATGVDDALPVVGKGAALDLAIATTDLTSSYALTISKKVRDAPAEVITISPVAMPYPYRASVDIVDLPHFLDSAFLAVSYEGDATNTANLRRIYMLIYEIAVPRKLPCSLGMHSISVTASGTDFRLVTAQVAGLSEIHDVTLSNIRLYEQEGIEYYRTLNEPFLISASYTPTQDAELFALGARAGYVGALTDTNINGTLFREYRFRKPRKGEVITVNGSWL